MRSMPPHTIPDSLQSVFAAAGLRAARPDGAIDGDPTLPAEGFAAGVSPDPVLTDVAESDLPPEPALTDVSEPDEPDDAPIRLDAARAAEVEPELARTGPAAVRPRGPVASFAVHAFALLAFFDWPAA